MNNNLSNCCKDCPDRDPYCHGTCEKFKEFLEWNEERKRKVKKAEAEHRNKFL